MPTRQGTDAASAAHHRRTGSELQQLLVERMSLPARCVFKSSFFRKHQLYARLTQ